MTILGRLIQYLTKQMSCKDDYSRPSYTVFDKTMEGVVKMTILGRLIQYLTKQWNKLQR